MASSQAPSLELLEPTSEEYASARTTLANSCQHVGRATGVVIYKINDSETAQRFDKLCRKKMKVSGWSNLSQLGSENEAGNLSTRGFVFGKGKGGLEFRVGVISDQLVPMLLDPSIEHSVVFSDLGVGRSYVEDGNLHLREIPEGYDSFYVPQKRLDRDGDGHFDVFEYNQAANFDGRDASVYEHRYFIKDSSQMRPRYIMKFRLQAMNAMPLQYSSSKEGSAESKEARDAEKPYDPLDEYSYFDPIAHKPVTLRDKMTMGSRSKVVLIPVDNAYKQALIDYAERDLLVENKKEWLEAQLDVIDDKVRQVNINYAEVVESIESAARKAIDQMESVTKVKLETLLSAEVEMRREKEQIEWMEIVSKRTAQSTASAIEKALTAQKQGMGGMPLPPTGILNTSAGANQGNNLLIESSREINKAQLEFLECWKNTARFRTTAGRYKPTEYLQSVREVQANMRVRSIIEVYGSKRSSVQGVYTVNDGALNDVAAGTRGTTGLSETLGAVEASSFYSEAVQPTAGGVHPLLHSAVDMEMEKIRAQLGEAIKNPDPAPLPRVIYRPPNTHDGYTMPLLVDLVSKDGGVRAARNLADQMQERGERGGHYDLKKQYYTRMDELLGKSPVTSKDTPKTAEQIQKDKLEDAKAKAVKAKAAQQTAMQKAKERKKEKERKEEERRLKELKERRLCEQREAEVKEQVEYAAKQRAMQDQQKIWKQQQDTDAARRAAVSQGLLHPGHAVATSMAASPTSKSSYLGGRQIMGVSSSSAGAPGSPVLGTYGKSMLIGGGFGKDNMKGINFGADELSNALQNFFGDISSVSMSFAATKRKEKMANSIFEDECQRMIGKLVKSDILTAAGAESIYFSLPFFSHPPSCERIYSAVLHTTGESISLNDLYEKCLINSSPSIIVIQSGDFVFGAYLSHPLRVSSTPTWAGSPSCFVFSVSLDIKCGFHGRKAAPETITATHTSLPSSFKCAREKLMIGYGDLTIKEGGKGESNLENCYGLGLAPDSPEALSMLAGAHEFVIDNIEVWSVNQRGST